MGRGVIDGRDWIDCYVQAGRTIPKASRKWDAAMMQHLGRRRGVIDKRSAERETAATT